MPPLLQCRPHMSAQPRVPGARTLESEVILLHALGKHILLPALAPRNGTLFESLHPTALQCLIWAPHLRPLQADPEYALRFRSEDAQRVLSSLGTSTSGTALQVRASVASKHTDHGKRRRSERAPHTKPRDSLECNPGVLGPHVGPCPHP